MALTKTPIELSSTPSIVDGGNATAITIDSSERVGIGVSSPQRSLVLGKSDSTGVQTQYTNSTTGAALGDGFTVGIDGSENAEFWNFENTNMLFATNGTERMRILSTGGITFNGDTAAANALDDYEEGTWTPSNTGNITVNAIENATYTKIGRQVTVSAWLKVNITSANGILGGLPFQVSGRGTASISNLTQQENFYNQGLGSTIYFYGATTTGTNDDFLLSFTYDS